MKPIIPFEPIRSDTIPTGDQWIYEVKWDGTRMLTYYDGEKTELFNRKKRNRTHHYPELLDISSYCKSDSVILDGEIIALAEDGKPSFHQAMRRDLIKKLDRVKEVQRVVPITYMIFDIVFYNGQWINEKPLKERKQILSSIIEPNNTIQLVSPHDDGEALFNAIEQQEMEGILCKDMESTYSMDGKDARWIKVKNYGDTIAVIGGFTLNGGIVNAVLLGQYGPEGMLHYIGHTGTGRLSKEDWRGLTNLLTPTVTKERPFVNKPERHNDAIWVKPKTTVKIQYSEWRWKEGRSLRQPSIQSFVDIPPEECKLPSH
jgi:bifunctional non-homologous end joining protein LigD